MSNVGKNIKNARNKIGMTQKELAEKLSVTRQAISNWENGKTEPDVETITKITQIFDISIDELVDGIPKGISELRGKKAHFLLGIIFISFYIISTIILKIIKNPLEEYISAYYDMTLYFILVFLVKPFTVILGGIGICFIIKYFTEFYVKNCILRIIFLVIGTICCILTTVYFVYMLFAFLLELSIIFSSLYYVFIAENPFIHVIGPILIFFGFAKKGSSRI